MHEYHLQSFLLLGISAVLGEAIFFFITNVSSSGAGDINDPSVWYFSFAKTSKIKYFIFLANLLVFKCIRFWCGRHGRINDPRVLGLKASAAPPNSFPYLQIRLFFWPLTFFCTTLNILYYYITSFKSWTCFHTEAILYFTSPILWNLYMALIWILPCWNIFIRFGEKSLARYWARPAWVYLVFMAMLMLIGCWPNTLSTIEQQKPYCTHASPLLPVQWAVHSCNSTL